MLVADENILNLNWRLTWIDRIDANIEFLLAKSISKATLIAGLSDLKAHETALIPRLLDHWVQRVYSATSDPAIAPFI